LLVSGAPGIGKTSLVNLIARTLAVSVPKLTP
jgi:MoxR-like ATPase